jgi:hypothetical protein
LSDDLLAWLAACTKDPVAFVLGAFPWSEPATALEKFSGPEPWQLEILQKIKGGLLNIEQAIQMATATGHGVGKSALVSWITLWALSTLPDTRGVITANTENQLKTKTWAELGKWFNLFIGREHFSLTATALMSKDPNRERTWRIDQIPWSEKNTEAFAGMHNQGKRLLLIMDEASAIPDRIWEVAEGALTDAGTQIIWLAFGNPTRNTGRFKECFAGGRFAKWWDSTQLDSRTVAITNKTQIDRWVEAYGEDSDFVRIRVRGVFPRHGELEFISAADVENAMARDVTTSLTDPLALGCDVARYGSNESVIAFRKGRDARTILWQFFRGLNTVELATRVNEAFHAYRTDGIFIDGGGVGGGVVDNCRHMQLFCFDVQFGGRDDVGGSATGNDGERYANKRAAMWGAMRSWIKTGALPADAELKAQLIGPTYTYNLKNEILLESKEEMMKRGVDSPDRADALALTFAYPLAAHAYAGGDHPKKPLVEFEYDPYDKKWMAA